MEGRLRPTDLVGGYTIVSGEKFGAPEPEDRIRGTAVRFTEDEVRVVDKDSKELYVARYELDPSREPCGIILTATHAPNAGDVARGLIEKRGDTVRLIYALPGVTAPTDFRTGERQLMFVMENQNR